jgi:hypothetical protein
VDSFYDRSAGPFVLEPGRRSVIVFCINQDNQPGSADFPVGGGYEIAWSPPRFGPVPDVNVTTARVFYLPEFESSGYSFALDNTTGEAIQVSISLICAARP